MSKMFQGFKDFIMRGNVVDLAVGIVIGAAFTGVVNGFTTGFIKPLIQLFGGDAANRAGTFSVHGAKFDYASFLNAIITFLITAGVLYFLVVFPLNALAERRRRGEEPPPKTPSEEVALLTEIRDALVRGQAPTAPQAQAFEQRYGRHQEPPR